jgi:Outer membrane protein beta-barrel domain
MTRIGVGAITGSCLLVASASAQDRPALFAGAVVGVSTLSADARSVTSPVGVAVSLYKPENGPALNVFGGRPVHEYLSIQANYVWNRNTLAVFEAAFPGTVPAFSEQMRVSTQHALVADALVYFREHRSRIRPYLSAGIGVVRFASTSRTGTASAPAVAPPEHFTETNAVLRVAVGIDARLAAGWRVRYTFSESLSRNPISTRLTPTGGRDLANFQNLFGVVREFLFGR